MNWIYFSLMTIGVFFFLLLLSCNTSKQNKIIEMNYDYNDFKEVDLPVVLWEADAKKYSGSVVYVIGIYQQQDVRMRQENPKILFKGHTSIRLKDNYPVLIYPPARNEAIRSKKEIKKFEGQVVKIKGTIYPYVPQKGNTMRTPCVLNIESIEKIDR